MISKAAVLMGVDIPSIPVVVTSVCIASSALQPVSSHAVCRIVLAAVL